MKKNFTFILLSLLLFVVGGAKSQTNLNITGGKNWEASEYKAEASPKWYSTDEGLVHGIVYFKESRSPRYCRVGGKAWATTFSAGATHTFTVTLNNSFVNQYGQTVEDRHLASGFTLVAVKGGVYSNNELTDDGNNWSDNSFKTDGDGSSSLKVVASTGPESTFTNNQLVLELAVEEDYDAVYLYAQDCNWKFIKIESIVRTEGAGSATAPTITPASTDYSGSIDVTITKGSGNTAVAYTVTGADGEDISTTFTAAELTAGSKTLSLTGSGNITVTATGSETGKDDSNTASCTYTYVIEAPTITPGTSNYDGELTVTITPGSNNHHAKYTVSGSNEDETNVEITSATTLNLTGSSNITITATGYNSGESESSSNTEYTYTYVAPSSGIISVWTDSWLFPDGNAGWNTSVELNKSNFSTLEVGDYIYLKVSTPHGEVPNIGFRNNWDDSCKSYTDTSGGNVAYGNMESDEPYWWLKVTDATLLSLFKDGQPRIQGQSFTLTGVEIHKAKTISETEDNTILKCSDYIINLDRTFVANTWNTVCLPFKPTADQADELFGSGYTIAQFDHVTGTTLEFKTFGIEDFEAGQPYLVKPTASLNTPVVLSDVNITAKNCVPVTHDGYSFTGTFTTKSFASDDWATTRFVAKGNKLNTPNSPNAMKALRCYFTVPAGSSARGYAIDGFMDDDVPTDISATLNDNVQTTKVIYNLAGQRVANPTKGLYIVNGQKVVVK